MKKRWIAVLLCAALLAAFGWGQPRISGEGETYDLYFLEADLSDAPGGDALRAEPLYIESGDEFFYRFLHLNIRQNGSQNENGFVLIHTRLIK